jgi:hypothetical protein
MESILENQIRIGRVSSSQAYRLLGTPALRKTYIKELMFERKMKRKLSLGKSTNSTNWGLFLEQFVHEKLSLDYITQAQTTISHPECEWWVGSPDTMNPIEKIVADIKCFEPLNFCNYLECLEQNSTEVFKKEYPKEYWQLISNADILGFDKIQVILYMPYEKDLEKIRNMAAAYDEYDAYKYRFIYELPTSQLACLPDDSEYKDLNIFTFEVPTTDRDNLRSAIFGLEI